MSNRSEGLDVRSRSLSAGLRYTVFGWYNRNIGGP